METGQWCVIVKRNCVSKCPKAQFPTVGQHNIPCLVSKRKVFLWTESCERAFQTTFELLNGAYSCKTHHLDARVFHLVPVFSGVLNGGESIAVWFLGFFQWLLGRCLLAKV